MIPRETIERIYAAAKIEEVIGDYVHLRKRGANLLGLCPFHNEKTGSFTVSPSKGIYKCFGCNASGHVVKFIMEIEQCSYVDAIKQLGRKYNIEIEERQLTQEEQKRQDDRESMFVVNDFCNDWFQRQLWETREGQAVGLSYFRQRGLRDDIIRKFQLGYSPERGNPLAKALQESGYKEVFITNNVDTKIGCGVCGKSEDGRLYDRFRDRVIFPIMTISGKTVAFAGRILKKKDNVGKYVNSPDSIIYSKTNELYGIYQAKHSISRLDMCYLVEGQMDVISMHQSGIENVVASGGTALTKPQIRLLKRFTSNITILYDGDAAGIKAASRGIDMFLEEGFNVKVLLLPEGEDPDSFAQSHDATEFVRYIQEHQTDLIRFKSMLLQKEASNDPHKRAMLIKNITASISAIPDMITRQVYIKDCAEQLHISEKVLTIDVINLRRKKMEEAKKASFSTPTPSDQSSVNKPAEEPTQAPVQQIETPIEPKTLLEKNYYNLIQLIVRYGEKNIRIGDTSSSIGSFIISALKSDKVAATHPVYQKIIDEYEAHGHEEGFEAEQFFKFHQDASVSTTAVAMLSEQYELSTLYTESSDESVDMSMRLGSVVAQCLYEIKLTLVTQQIADIKARLEQAQQSNDWEAQRALLAFLPKLMEQKKLICQKLGNRTVTN